MNRLVTTYRILAYVVGVLLAFCAVTSIFKYALPDGSTLQQFGADLAFMWAFHGWIYMIYVVVAFFLWRRTDWSLSFALLVLVAGLIPLLIFWVERQVERKLHGEPTPLDEVTSS